MSLVDKIGFAGGCFRTWSRPIGAMWYSLTSVFLLGPSVGATASRSALQGSKMKGRDD